MSASQCRGLGPAGHGGGRGARCTPGASRGAVGGRRGAVGLGVAIIALGIGLIQPGRSGGQEPAAKAKAKAEAPKAAEPAPALDTTGALSLRYRFIEAYSVDENPSKPELIGSYQVGSLETINSEEERAQGAPVRKGYNVRVLYTERAAKVTKFGEVTDLVRRYDDFRVGGDLAVLPATPPLLKDLSIWCTFQKVGLPMIISLTDQRPLRQEEFSLIHDKLFLPQLSSILPAGPVRVADTWNLKPRASRSLLGNSVPDDGGAAFDVVGRLVDVKKAAEGNTWTARIEISGTLMIGDDPAGVIAWIYFEFVPPPAVEPAPKPKSPDKAGIVEARGHVARVSMSRQLIKRIDADGRLNYILTRELNLARRPASNSLRLPEVPPVPNQANSWVRYDDPDKRFHFSHPQSLHLVSDTEKDRDSIELRSSNPTESDVVYFGIQREQLDPVRNRQSLEPEYHIRNLRAIWKEKERKVTEGESVWLAEDAAAPKRSIHRFEAALLNGPRAARAYCDQYLLIDPKGSLVLRAITETDRGEAHVAFRSQVENLIRSFAFDQKIGAGVPPSRLAPGAAPAGPQDRPR